MSIKAGDRVPAGKFKTATADGLADVTSEQLFNNKRVVFFAVPGAFTPTCDAKHLPGYLELADQIRARGVDTIACMSVNDVFVMKAWGKASGADGKVLMLADGNGDYARALGLTLDATGFGMGQRSQRFALVVKNGVVEQVHVEAGGEFKVSAADYVLARL
jgi:peroxiredoxin